MKTVFPDTTVQDANLNNKEAVDDDQSLQRINTAGAAAQDKVEADDTAADLDAHRKVKSQELKLGEQHSRAQDGSMQLGMIHSEAG